MKSLPPVAPGPRSSRPRCAQELQKRCAAMGGFVRSTWDEVNEIIAAANAYTIKKLRPGPRDRLLADPGDVDGQLRRRLAAT
jgi:hypothetical protein